MAHAAPYKTITDPAIIQKKNELRKAVSEEYIKHTSNPYRNIKMEGGTLVCIRYSELISQTVFVIDIVLFFNFSLMSVFKDTCL